MGKVGGRNGSFGGESRTIFWIETGMGVWIVLMLFWIYGVLRIILCVLLFSNFYIKVLP